MFSTQRRRDTEKRTGLKQYHGYTDTGRQIQLRVATSTEARTKINQLTEQIIGAAMEVHRTLGPGLLESAYEECLCRELALRQIPFERQRALPVEYKGLRLDCGYRLDILVNGAVVVELKTVEQMLPVHKAQVLTYLRLGGWKVGLLLNFNASVLKDGIARVVHGLEE